MTTLPLLVDLNSAAAALSISKRGIQELIYRGTLPSVSLGRRRLLVRADLEAFVNSLRPENETAPATLNARAEEARASGHRARA